MELERLPLRPCLLLAALLFASPSPASVEAVPSAAEPSAVSLLEQLGERAELIPSPTRVSITLKGDQNQAESDQETNPWQKLASDFRLQHDYQHERVRARARYYARHARSTRQILKRALNYLPYITQRVEKRGFPAELALIPAVESHFKPGARASSQATGLWQFMPRTAQRWGLTLNQWYDARLDPFQSTHAAMDYLAYLHRRYNNWLLTLAAYNAGGGTVDNALDGDDDASYWDLDLPEQTENYIPRILGFAELIAHPQRYNFHLPANAPGNTLVQVNFSAPVTLAAVAKAAGITLATLHNHNPARLGSVLTPATPMHLYLPRQAAQQLLQQPPAIATAYANLFRQRYRVQPGDTLSGIAHAHQLPTTKVMAWNHITHPRHLQIGQRLTLWLQRGTAGTHTGFYPIRLRMEKNSTLPGVARRYHVDLGQLYAWNDLTPKEKLPDGAAVVILLSAQHS